MTNRQQIRSEFQKETLAYLSNAGFPLLTWDEIIAIYDRFGDNPQGQLENEIDSCFAICEDENNGQLLINYIESECRRVTRGMTTSVLPLNRFWSHFCKNIPPTPSEQIEIFNETYQRLQTQYPDQDNYWLNYWTSRLVFFTHWLPETATLTMDNSQEPNIITLVYKPDYSS